MTILITIIPFILIILGNPNTKQLSETPKKINAYTFKEILKIDNDEGFYNSTKTTISSSGRIIVLDLGNKRVFVYNSIGKLEFEYGKEGNGPGELTNRSTLYSTKDRIIIGRSERVMIFNMKGELLSEIPMTEVGFDSEFIINENSITFLIPAFSKYKIINFDLTGKKGKFVLNSEYDPKVEQMEFKFMDYKVYNNFIISINRGPYEINFYNDKLELVKSIKRNFLRVKIDPDKFIHKVIVKDDSKTKEEKAEIIASAKRNAIKKIGGYNADIDGILGEFDSKLFIKTFSYNKNVIYIDVLDKDDSYFSSCQVNLDNAILRDSRIENGKLIINYVDEKKGPYIKIYSISKN